MEEQNLKASVFKKEVSLGQDSKYWGVGYPKPKKKQGVVPITEEEWNAMIPKAQWDSIVALRGPDLKNSDTLKYFTSSVIRHRMSGIMRVGGMVNRDFPFVIYPQGAKDTSMFSASHFIGHIREAAHWLNIPVIMVSQKTWDLIVKGIGTLQVCCAILADLGESPQATIVKEWLEKQGMSDEGIKKIQKEVLDA
jgi:hypothetical protein